MTARSWVGGGDDDAYTATHWSPAGLAAGDDLTMSAGTISIPGGDLDGNTLTLLTRSTTINLSAKSNVKVAAQPNNSPVTVINTDGDDTLSLLGPLPSALDATINIGSNATLSANFDFTFGKLNVTPRNGSALMLNGVQHFNGTLVRFGADIIGNATIDVARAQSLVSVVTLDAPVTSGITFLIDTPPVLRPGNAGVVIPNADVFHNFDGVIDIKGGYLGLTWGQPIGDNYTYENGRFQLWNGNTKINTIRLTNDTGSSLHVEQNDKGVLIASDDTLQPGGVGTSLLRIDSYDGPVAGIEWEIINITTENLNIAAPRPNMFIRAGSGNDGIDVSRVNGTNILDASTGTNFLTGGSGHDTFYIDDRNATQDIFTTIRGFHSGDDATIWGLTPDDFKITPSDDVLPSAPGLDFAITADGKPNANFNIPGYHVADLSNGRLQVSFGRTGDLPGLPGSDYMLVHAT